MSVFVADESGAAVDTAALSDLLRFALDRLGVHPQAEVSLLAVDLTAMSDLHEQWMDEPGPTDVMSFPMDELTERGSWEADPAAPGPALLGDIVICPQFAAGQAAERGHGLVHELHILVVHGLLHLLGWDHAEPEDEKEMFARQEAVVAAFEQLTAAPAGSAVDLAHNPAASPAADPVDPAAPAPPADGAAETADGADAAQGPSTP